MSADVLAVSQVNWVRLDQAMPPLVHELRNVLAALNMALDLADARLRAAGAAKGAQLHAAAAPVVAHANALLEDLLALARPQQVRCAPFDLREVVAEVAHAPEAVPGAPASVGPPDGGALELRLPPEAIAHGDAGVTAKALRHVLRNAREALAANGGHVAVELRAGVNAGEATFEIHVLDDGPGVADEVRARLFAPFVSNKRRHLGLGLAQAWRAMRAQSGRIELTGRAVARYGRGASFCLVLPQADVPKRRRAPAGAAPKKVGAP